MIMEAFKLVNKNQINQIKLLHQSLFLFHKESNKFLLIIEYFTIHSIAIKMLNTQSNLN